MPVNKSALVTRPQHEVVTNYLCVWSEDVLTMKNKQAGAMYDLKGDKATKKNFESYFFKHKPAFIFLNGHGNENVIAGHDDEILIDDRSKFEGSIIYARSCDAGRKLGNVLVKNGLATFIGYSRKFIFAYDTSKITHPRNDKLAGIFLEPSNLVASTILKGHTAEEAHRRAKEAMYRNFRKMLSSEASYEERYAARWLWGNINSQVLLGNPNQKI